jgi:SAM-dependent methyltransferase
MTELFLDVTMGVVVGRVTSWPANLPVGDGRGLLAQRYGRYVAGSAGHRDRTPPDLAAALVQRYSRPGNLVLDPCVGTGTMLVEAVHAGRDGLGMDIEAGWVSLACTNLALAARRGATGRAQVIHGDATRLPAQVPTGLRGTADLVLTSAPIGKTMPAYRRGHRYSGGPRIGRVTAGTGLGQVLTGCAALLRPGGRLAVVLSRDPAHRRLVRGEPNHVVPAGRRAGLDVVDYLFADQRGQLLTRYPGDQLTGPPRAINGAVLMLPAVAAYDVVVFGKPDQVGDTVMTGDPASPRGPGATPQLGTDPAAACEDTGRSTKRLPHEGKSTYPRRPARRTGDMKPTSHRLRQGQEPGRTPSPCPPHARPSPVSRLSNPIGRPSIDGTPRPQSDSATTAGRQ